METPDICVTFFRNMKIYYMFGDMISPRVMKLIIHIPKHTPLTLNITTLRSTADHIIIIFYCFEADD